MYLYLGILLMIHAMWSLIEFRKVKVKYTGSHYVPIDIQLEFFIGAFLIFFYITTLFKKLKTIHKEQKPQTQYSKTLQSTLRDFQGKRKYYLSQMFLLKYEELVKLFKM